MKTNINSNVIFVFLGFETGVQASKPIVAVEPVILTEQTSHWGENRLADVVKGTVKAAKVVSTKDAATSGGDVEIVSGGVGSPRAQSPVHATNTSQPQAQAIEEKVETSQNCESTTSVVSSTVTLTPPSSPEK